MAGEDNLIPFHERTEEEQREIRRKGGIASGKARRRKSNIKKALEIILTMDAPTQKMYDTLVSLGLDPSTENALVLNTVIAAIGAGDPKGLETIARLVGQTTTLADRQEQKARIERMKIETDRLKHDVAVKSGDIGKDEAESQIVAIADLINNPVQARTIDDYAYPVNPEDPEAPEAEEVTADD